MPRGRGGWRPAGPWYLQFVLVVVVVVVVVVGSSERVVLIRPTRRWSDGGMDGEWMGSGDGGQRNARSNAVRSRENQGAQQ